MEKRKSSRLVWALPLAIGAAFALVVAVGMNRHEEEPPPPAKRIANVEVREVVTVNYREGLTLPARVEARTSAAVAAEFGGRLSRWEVAEGGAVTKGAVVAELDTDTLVATRREIEARLASAHAAIEAAARGAEASAAAADRARRDVDAAGVEVRAAQSALDLARTEYGRTEALVNEGVLDRAKLDHAKDARTQAELGVERAEEGVARARLAAEAALAASKEAAARDELARAQAAEADAALASVDVRLEKHRIRSPIDGRLEEHLAEPGEVVSTGQVLARIYDLARVRAVVDVPDRYVPFLDPTNPALLAFIKTNGSGAKPAVRATLVIPGLPKLTGGKGEGIALDASIARVGLAADPASNTFPVELSAKNPGGALRDGLIAEAHLAFLDFPEAVVIPIGAVEVTDQGPKVFVAEKEGESDVARRRDIEPLSIRGDEVHVGAGLLPGDRLIVSGWKGLVAGEPVNVVVENGATR